MKGIVINIDPVIFHLGSFGLRWHNVTIILAIVTAIVITAYHGKKKGITAREVNSLALWVVLAGIVGAYVDKALLLIRGFAVAKITDNPVLTKV